MSCYTDADDYESFFSACAAEAKWEEETRLTYGQYLQLILWVGGRLGLAAGEALHFFNLPPPESVCDAVAERAGGGREEEEEGEEEGTDAVGSCGGGDDNPRGGTGESPRDATNNETKEEETDKDDVDRLAAALSRSPGAEGAWAAAVTAALNPPCCAHLFHCLSLDALPTVVDAAAVRAGILSPSASPASAAARRRPRPCVHCLQCLEELQEQMLAQQEVYGTRAVPSLVAAEDLGGWDDTRYQEEVDGGEAKAEGFVQHHARHRRRRDKFLRLLEGEEVAYLGESGDEFDLETEDGAAACEAAAAAEGRHACFVASAGGRALPTMVRYCAECRQVAPLVSFAPPTGAVSAAGDVHAPAAAVEWVTIENANTVLARLLLACHVLALAGLARISGGSGSEATKKHGAVHRDDEEAAAAAADAVTRVFLYKPELVPGDDDFTEAFEDGVERTYVSAVLPGAAVVVPRARRAEAESGDRDANTSAKTAKEAPNAIPLLAAWLSGAGDQDCNSNTPAVTAAALDQARLVVMPAAPPTSNVSEGPAVRGFVMEWSSAAEAQAKMDMVAARDNSYMREAPVRLAYAEDAREWMRVRVPCHYRVCRRLGLNDGGRHATTDGDAAHEDDDGGGSTDNDNDRQGGINAGGHSALVATGRRGVVADFTTLFAPYTHNDEAADPVGCIQVCRAEEALAAAPPPPPPLSSSATHAGGSGHSEGGGGNCQQREEEEETADGAEGEEEEEQRLREMSSAPYSLDSRTSDFLHQMMLLATVMGELLNRPAPPPPPEES